MPEKLLNVVSCFKALPIGAESGQQKVIRQDGRVVKLSKSGSRED